MRALGWRLAALQEAERRSLARELHDEIGQQLTGLNLAIEMVSRRLDDTAREELLRVQKAVMEIMDRVREISLDLRPSMLDHQGLVPALQWLLRRFGERSGIDVEFEHEGLNERLPSEVETAAYRIVQEGLTNIARHAGTTSGHVSLTLTDRALCVEIRDEGTGFHPDAVQAGYRSGLDGIRERAVLLRGNFDIRSTPGKGTTLSIELPCSPDVRGGQRRDG